MKKIFLCLILGFFLLFNNAYGANFDVSIEGTEGYGIAGFSVWLEVDENFELTDSSLSRESGVPSVWWDDSNLGSIVNDSSKKVLKLGASDFLALGNPSGMVPLNDGLLFSFDYSGSILNPSLIKLSDIDGFDYFANGDFFVKSFDDSGIMLSSVPIPSSLLLLGCGIFAVAGISRRKK